ncbi:MAG: hypothetical protein WBI55_02880 [Eubacteriales bacterium]|nr:hypothetical protein [Clostridiales bacterium]
MRLRYDEHKDDLTQPLCIASAYNISCTPGFEPDYAGLQALEPDNIG